MIFTHVRKVMVMTLVMVVASLGMGESLPRHIVKANEPFAAPKKQIAVVIDDFGNNMNGTTEMLDLAIPLTIAVMPFMPTSKRDAQLAHERGHEVLVHMPMEPVKGKKSWLGPGAITTDLSDEEIRSRVEAALDDVPFAVGINNHMGSKATADERVMRIVMQVCKERGMMFLDSRTTPKSVIVKLAKEMGVPYAENELFFDDVYTSEHISKQMSKLLKLIEKQDQCIAIGHVGPPGKITASVLKASISTVQKGASFVPVSKLMKGLK